MFIYSMMADQNNLSTSNSDTPTNDKFDIRSFESTRNLIAKQLQLLEKIKQEIKQHRESMQAILDNDPQYGELENQTKEYQNKLKQRKLQLLESQNARKIKLKIAELSDERRDIEESLTAHLLDLYQATGVMEFEDQEGHLWTYQLKARISRSKNI